ncbi:MAG: DUF2723 domain-containing protein, partial [Anaerolineae bacterium]
MVVAAPLDVDQVGAPGMRQGTPVIHRAPAARPALAPSLLVGLTSLVVYLLTLAPSITWQHHGADSAELAVAAAVLGVPHPPGYPTWTLLAWLFTHLPLAELAQRVALLSAFSAAATVAIVAWLVQALWPHQPGQRAAAVLAGLTLAFQHTFWSQAILVEVYALHALFVALICALTLPQAPGHPGRRRVAAFLFGLGLGNHLSLIFFAPLLLWDGSPRFDGGAIVSAAQSRGFRDLTLLPLPLLAGLAVYLYLPLAAGRHPVLLWGDATTPGGFWWLVSGQLYRGALFGLTVPEMLMRAQSWLSLLAQPLTWPGLILAALGLWRLATQARRLALLTVGVALMVAIVALGYATADAFVYLLPLQVLAALWQAAGVLTLAAWLTRGVTAQAAPLPPNRGGKSIRLPQDWGAGGHSGRYRDHSHCLVAWLTRGRADGWIWLLCLLPVALLWHNWANVDLSRDTEARQYALAALAAAAP